HGAEEEIGQGWNWTFHRQWNGKGSETLSFPFCSQRELSSGATLSFQRKSSPLDACRSSLFVGESANFSINLFRKISKGKFRLVLPVIVIS
ncbi:MAG: hypothetical protein ACXWMJ_07930, partial [Syntrophales bacterium]